MSKYSKLKRQMYKQSWFSEPKEILTEDDCNKTSIWYRDINDNLYFTTVSAILTQITDCGNKIETYFVDKHEVNKHIFLGVRGAIEYDLKLLPKCPDRYRLYDHCIANGHITPSVMIFGSGDIFASMSDNPSKKMSYKDLGKLHEDRKRLREEFMNRGNAYE